MAKSQFFFHPVCFPYHCNYFTTTTPPPPNYQAVKKPNKPQDRNAGHKDRYTRKCVCMCVCVGGGYTGRLESACV